MSFILALGVLGLFTTVEALTIPQSQHGINWQPCPEFNKNITISSGIQGASFDCAKLSVPLDYTDHHSAPLELALFRVNATKEPVLGSVLINFGGPGGTGAENLPAWAERMAVNIGDQWNLVSWDPRGTGKTIPFDCVGDSLSAATNNRKRDVPTLSSANLTEYFLNGGWEYSGSVADLCYSAMNETGQYISSAFVARDMIKIVDALNEDGLLRYYGWSYGTALGSIVAAMFPERVERIVLDANVNPHDYQAGHYGDFLIDADKAFWAFLTECFNNKDDCALAQYTKANSTQDILDAINLIYQPIAANASTSDEAWAVYLAVAEILYSKLYFPVAWREQAVVITTLLNGTYAPPNSTATYNEGTWAATGIRASDAIYHPASPHEYLPIVLHQQNVSSFNHQYPYLWASARWRIQSKEQYKGNFKVKTRHPILYVNGEFDPATPLIDAYNGSAGFEGSVVLPHSGYGHGIVVDPSACVARNVRAYFENGTLPVEGTHCEPDMGPWEMARAKA